MGRKGQELSTDVKNMIVEMFQNGFSRRKIGDIFKFPKSTVIDNVRKFLDTGAVENKPRSGRPLFVKPRDYRKLERIVKTSQRSSLCDITNKFNEENYVPVSKRTSQHHLHKHGYHRHSDMKEDDSLSNNAELLLTSRDIFSSVISKLVVETESESEEEELSSNSPSQFSRHAHQQNQSPQQVTTIFSNLHNTGYISPVAATSGSFVSSPAATSGSFGSLPGAPSGTFVVHVGTPTICCNGIRTCSHTYLIDCF
ncbi:unnamed protein product [Mytilus coruscus]|uniref:Uncharacterized protein n=1 Tax=Mytilus coruscus TaxID=42192 RepID=A0A6J8A0F3_MYTCO|nr:unnamed protein product [Mytilus coruscus]